MRDETISPTATGEFVFSDKVPYGTHDLVITVPGEDDEEITFAQPIVVSAEENFIEVKLAGEIELTNAGFEMSAAGEGLDIPGWKGGKPGWRYATGISFSDLDYAYVSDEQAYEGTRSIKLDGSKLKGTTRNLLNEPKPAIPGFIYTASVQVYADTSKGELSPRPMLYMDFLNAKGERIKLSTAKNSTASSNDAWELVTSTTVAPPDTAEIVVLISTNTTYGATNYFDDFKLEFSRP